MRHHVTSISILALPQLGSSRCVDGDGQMSISGLSQGCFVGRPRATVIHSLSQMVPAELASTSTPCRLAKITRHQVPTTNGSLRSCWSNPADVPMGCGTVPGLRTAGTAAVVQYLSQRLEHHRTVNLDAAVLLRLYPREPKIETSSHAAMPLRPAGSFQQSTGPYHLQLLRWRFIHRIKVTAGYGKVRSKPSTDAEPPLEVLQ